MLEQIEYTASWIHCKLQNRLGQRGAEMVEYAIILACIAVLAAWFYSTDAPNKSENTYSKQRTMVNIVNKLWVGIKDKISVFK